jgi:hypothetical protein
MSMPKASRGFAGNLTDDPEPRSPLGGDRGHRKPEVAMHPVRGGQTVNAAMILRQPGIPT